MYLGHRPKMFTVVRYNDISICSVISMYFFEAKKTYSIL